MVSFSFLLSSTVLLFIAEFFRKRFPNQYDTFMTGFYFNLIFLYTQIQILSKKTYNKLAKDYPSLHDKVQQIYNSIQFFVTKDSKNVYEFVKDGEIIVSFTEQEINCTDFEVPSENSYDFFVFSDFKNKCVVKTIHRDILSAQSPTILSKNKFILSEITLGIDEGDDKTIKISFSTDKYNYLAKNNIIDKKFLKYFMKKHYLNEIENTDVNLLQNYKLKIIDSDVRINVYDSTCQIIILEDGYTTLEVKPSLPNEDESNMVSDVYYESTQTI